MIDSRDRIVLGAPGVLGLWVFDLVKRMVALSGPEKPTAFPVERSNEIPPLGAAAKGRILLCHYPNAQIAAALTTGLAPVMYVSEPARQVAEFLVRHTGRSPIEAVRVCSAAYVGNLAMRSLPDAAVIDRSLPYSALKVAGLVAAWLELDIAEDKLEDLMARFAGGRQHELIDHVLEHYRGGAAGGSEETPENEALLETLSSNVLEPMLDLAFLDQPPAICWPAESFYLADVPDAKKLASSNSFVELAGPARILLHGPYLHLPAARYRAQITVDVRDFIKEVLFRVDVYSGATSLGKFKLVARHEGRSAAEFEFEVVDPIPETQAQFVSERGAIFGEVKVLSLTLTPISAAPSKPDELPHSGEITEVSSQ